MSSAFLLRPGAQRPGDESGAGSESLERTPKPDSGESRVRRDVVAAAVRTLGIMHEWGYAPTLASLASNLVGGEVPPEVLETTLFRSGSVHIVEGHVCLQGNEALLGKSTQRARTNSNWNGHAQLVAQEFARNLVNVCPFVKCVAVTGSLASGGFDEGDDIDFDLFVEEGTKYMAYLAATLVGLRYSWRRYASGRESSHKVLFVPKVICINVVWPDDQSLPFVRQDAHVAFELLRCRPLYGSLTLRRVCQANSWMADYFPQLFDRTFDDTVDVGETRIRKFLRAALGDRRLKPLFETASRGIVWMLYQIARWSRRRSPSAIARMDYLRRVKWPYEVLQD
jgi:hypothetical protein